MWQLATQASFVKPPNTVLAVQPVVARGDGHGGASTGGQGLPEAGRVVARV
eukprot:SAG22_NODE_8857_length_625_cov_7.446768_1_plen_50_part_10